MKCLMPCWKCGEEIESGEQTPLWIKGEQLGIALLCPECCDDPEFNEVQTHDS